MDWPCGEKKYQVEKMIEAAQNPHITREDANKIVDYAANYIYSLPAAIQNETAKLLISAMGGNLERSMGIILTPENVPQQGTDVIQDITNVGTHEQVPTLPYQSKVKRKRVKL